MKRFILGVIVGIVVTSMGFGGYIVLKQNSSGETVLNPALPIKTYPLKKYSIPELKNRTPQGANFKLLEPTATTSAYTVFPFSFTTEKKLATGIAHIPNSCNEQDKCPVILQSRGFVEPTQYYPGAGTSRSAQEYAKAGFISLAPDFLGFGGSDTAAEDVFEERFQKYTVDLDLLSVISTIPMADYKRIGLWGHSNGGHVTLTVLEATGNPYPTVLWAPVSAPFPFSILFYSDDTPDYGKALRKDLARFEKDYNTDQFTLVNYLDGINAKIQLHQGVEDVSVPVYWSRNLYKKLKELNKDITYYEYPNADHNLKPDWNTVVSRDIEFFTKELVK